MKKTMGIDVDSRYLETCIVIDENRSNAIGKRFHNREKEFSKLLKYLRSYKVSRVLMEASGGYEQKIAHYLAAHEIKVQVVNPRRARNFAKGIGLKAKTDKIDAFALGRMAQVVKFPTESYTSPSQLKLKKLVVRRSQLKEDIQAERNRKGLADVVVKKSIEKHIQFLQEEIDNIEERIKEIIRSDKKMEAKKNVLIQFKGIGDITAATMIGLIPELGHISNKKVTSLVGLAPIPNDSGKFKGKRFISGGRARPRKALYMPAWVAVRCDPEMKTFYNRLIENKKLKKVAIVAVMRKLLIRANAALRRYLEAEEKEIPVAA